jgi:hypothetical protein
MDVMDRMDNMDGMDIREYLTVCSMGCSGWLRKVIYFHRSV